MMERRAFIKNIGAIAIISQIGITKALPKDSKEVVTDFILRSSDCTVKMNLLSIEQKFSDDHIRYDRICIEAALGKEDAEMTNAIVNVYFLQRHEPVEFIYEPHNSNTKLEGSGYITDWELLGDEVRFSISVSRLMTIT